MSYPNAAAENLCPVKEALIRQQAQPFFSLVRLSGTCRGEMMRQRKRQKVVMRGKKTDCDVMRRRSKIWSNKCRDAPGMQKAKPDKAEE